MNTHIFHKLKVWVVTLYDKVPVGSVKKYFVIKFIGSISEEGFEFDL